MHWYHGSPLLLEILAAGSTVTRNRELARVFASKPGVVSWEDDGSLRHNGHETGYLYELDEPLCAGDLRPHPRSTMPPGAEWLTQRSLRLRLLERTRPDPAQRLTPDEIQRLTGG